MAQLLTALTALEKAPSSVPSTYQVSGGSQLPGTQAPGTMMLMISEGTITYVYIPQRDMHTHVIKNNPFQKMVNMSVIPVLRRQKGRRTPVSLSPPGLHS